MKLTYEDYDQLSVLNLKGELVADDIERFQRAVQQRMEEADIRDFVIDCSGLEFIDSKGLEAMLWLQELCAERLGQVRLAGCREHVETILEMTRLAPRFDCHADIESAIKSLR